MDDYSNSNITSGNVGGWDGAGKQIKRDIALEVVDDYGGPTIDRCQTTAI